jgi:hypothetical protein
MPGVLNDQCHGRDASFRRKMERSKEKEGEEKNKVFVVLLLIIIK